MKNLKVWPNIGWLEKYPRYRRRQAAGGQDTRPISTTRDNSKVRQKRTYFEQFWFKIRGGGFSVYCFLWGFFPVSEPPPPAWKVISSWYLQPSLLQCTSRLQNPRFRGKKLNCNAVNKLGPDLKPTGKTFSRSRALIPISYLHRRPPHSWKLKTLGKNYFTTQYIYLNKGRSICISNLIWFEYLWWCKGSDYHDWIFGLKSWPLIRVYMSLGIGK